MNTCPACNTENTQKYLDWKKFTINKCQGCKLIFALPTPTEDELAEYYQGFLFNKPEKYEIEKKVSLKIKELKHLFKVDNLENKTFLDFGGGTGVAFKAATELGLKAYYFDLDKQAEEFTKTNLGLTDDFIIKDMASDDRNYDLIFSDNVIEHLIDPVSFLETLTKKLNKNGTLVIKTPHGGNTAIFFNPYMAFKSYFLQAIKYNSVFKSLIVLFKVFWHCDPPRHIYSFSKDSFKFLVNKTNVKNISHETSYYEAPIFSNTITKQFFTRDKNLSLIKSILVRLIIFPIIPIETTFQLIGKILLKLKILSPEGIILTIKRID